MIKSMKSVIHQVVMSPFFLLCIVGNIFLLFTAGTYRTDAGVVLTPIQMLMQFSREQLCADAGGSILIVLQHSLYGYYVVFAPVLMALPFVLIYSNERKTGYVRFRMQREGKKRYILCRILCAELSGIFVALLSFLLFTICASILFPNHTGWTWHKYFQMLASMAVFGGFSALPALLFLAFSRNMYLVLASPFMLTYIWNIFMNSIINTQTDCSGQMMFFWEAHKSYAPNLIPDAGWMQRIFITVRLLFILGLTIFIFVRSFYRGGDCCA